MELKVKKLEWEAGGAYAVLLNEATAKEMGVFAGDRVLLRWASGEIAAVVDTTRVLLPPGLVGLSKELWSDFEIPQRVEVKGIPIPESVKLIKKRLLGEPLSKEEIERIVEDMVKNKLSPVEKAYFVASAFVHKLSQEEEAALTLAMVNTGKRIEFSREDVADKHSIGGVPGNRVTPIVVPIIAAAGHLIPKTSSRAITSPAGTADVVEIFANVEVPVERLKEIVEVTGGAMVWGGATEIAPADDLLIKVRYSLKLDPPGFVVSSIMAKKIAVGAKYLVVDIPLYAKVKTLEEARALARKFIALGKRVGMKVKVAITDGSQPIGRGIGPGLEARDVLEVLNGNGPQDLKNKAVKLSGILLEMLGHRDGEKLALKLLETGKAFEKFREIVEAQGKKVPLKPEAMPLGRFTAEIKAKEDISQLLYDSRVIADTCRILGAPVDKGAGMYLEVPPRGKVRANEVIARLYSNEEGKLNAAVQYLQKHQLVYKGKLVIEIL